MFWLHDPSSETSERRHWGWVCFTQSKLFFEFNFMNPHTDLRWLWHTLWPPGWSLRTVTALCHSQSKPWLKHQRGCFFRDVWLWLSLCRVMWAAPHSSMTHVFNSNLCCRIWSTAWCVLAVFDLCCLTSKHWKEARKKEKMNSVYGESLPSWLVVLLLAQGRPRPTGSRKTPSWRQRGRCSGKPTPPVGRQNLKIITYLYNLRIKSQKDQIRQNVKICVLVTHWFHLF